jgi:hypothetical protein
MELCRVLSIYSTLEDCLSSIIVRITNTIINPDKEINSTGFCVL